MSNIRNQLDSLYTSKTVKMILFNGKVVEKTISRDKLYWLEEGYAYDKEKEAYDLRKPKESEEK